MHTECKAADCPNQDARPRSHSVSYSTVRLNVVDCWAVPLDAVKVTVYVFGDSLKKPPPPHALNPVMAMNERSTAIVSQPARRKRRRSRQRLKIGSNRTSAIGAAEPDCRWGDSSYTSDAAVSVTVTVTGSLPSVTAEGFNGAVTPAGKPTMSNPTGPLKATLAGASVR